MQPVASKFKEFVAFVAKLQGDEKGETQVFLDHLFRSFGRAGIIEIGGRLEHCVRWNSTTKFADLGFITSGSVQPPILR